MPLLHLERLGMCGSAVLNDKEELVGIHTGSRFDPFDPDAATYSYVVPADYLRSLVNAYHQGEKGTIPFYLSKDHTIALPPNEYIYSYELLDKHGKPLLGQTGFNYFSRSLFSTSLNAYPKSKFLRLKTKQLNWDSEGYLLLPGEVLFENSHKIYLYDLTKKEIVSVKQENWF